MLEGLAEAGQLTDRLTVGLLNRHRSNQRSP